MFKIAEVKVLPDYRLWLRYANGVEGEISVADLAGKGVFRLWNDYDAFERVRIGERGELAWNEEIDLCPDALYLRLTGQSPDEVFPNLREVGIDA